MSVHYEKARAIAEAAANRWDKFGDTAGVGWLAEQIHHAISSVAQPDELAGILHKAFSHPDAVDHSAEVVGLPMLIRTKDGWYALGEDGTRFNLVCASRNPRAVDPPDDRDLCACKIGQCHLLTERCREVGEVR